jgi:alpha-N-arabinofuranosidase
MTTTTIVLHDSFTIGTIDRRLFGSFVEHMGRTVYTGIYEKGHPTADPSGFRGDVFDLVTELGPTMVR